MENKNEKKVEKKGVLALIRDRKGMSTVEYAILLAVITAIAFTTWQNFGKKVHDSIKASDKKIKL